MSNPNVDPRPSLSDNVPSSFDDNPEFFEEKRVQKLWRRLKEEPLIPVGCAATVYALYQASKSIRAGDHHQTNRMFRARIYAQGFTLLALVGGSLFYQDERMRRKKFEAALEDKKAAEKREKWLKELDARDKEDKEWRERFEGVAQRAKEVEEQVMGEVKKGVKVVDEELDKAKKEMEDLMEERFRNKSIYEEALRSGCAPGSWAFRTRRAWRKL